MDLILRILPAGAMATCAGFRAFLPLFVINYLLRSGNLGLDRVNPVMKTWLIDNDPVFYFLAVMTLIEILGDKIPSLFNVLEIILMFIRPAAGVLVCFTLLNLRDPNLNFIGAVALAAALTLPFQGLKSSVKILSDRGPFGMYNLTHSLVVDVEAFAGIVLAFVVPYVAFFVNPVTFYSTMEGFKNWRVRLIAGQEMDLDFNMDDQGMEDFLEVKQLKKIGKKK